jgi:hypothetical protein
MSGLSSKQQSGASARQLDSVSDSPVIYFCRASVVRPDGRAGTGGPGRATTSGRQENVFENFPPEQSFGDFLGAEHGPVLWSRDG